MVSQLDANYGKDEARNFITNHAAQITFAPRDQRDANEYSDAFKETAAHSVIN